MMQSPSSNNVCRTPLILLFLSLFLSSEMSDDCSSSECDEDEVRDEDEELSLIQLLTHFHQET